MIMSKRMKRLLIVKLVSQYSLQEKIQDLINGKIKKKKKKNKKNEK